MEHNRYIGPATKFKEYFGFSQQVRPASRASLYLAWNMPKFSGRCNGLAASNHETSGPGQLGYAAAKNQPHFANMAKASLKEHNTQNERRRRAGQHAEEVSVTP
jgi:hypothetical protein